MLVVNLLGGLGNQLFQYAFGCAQAAGRQLPLRFDTTELLDRQPKPDFTYRDFELGVFAGAVPLASAAEVALFRHEPAGLPERVYYKVQRSIKQPQLYQESQYFAYDAGVWNTRPNTYFDGYWQSEKYFAAHAPLIRQNLLFKNAPTGENARLAQQIQAQPAVSVHVRRGDYVSNAHTGSVHGTCTPAYYEQTVQYITERVSGAVLYIFSDEPDWVRQNMHFEAPTVYVAHNQGKSSFEDMRLMSLCQHHVIANSSFSWWGAWLNPQPDKLVVAPRQWLQTPGLDFTDLIPDTWLTM